MIKLIENFESLTKIMCLVVFGRNDLKQCARKRNGGERMDLRINIFVDSCRYDGDSAVNNFSEGYA